MNIDDETLFKIMGGALLVGYILIRVMMSGRMGRSAGSKWVIRFFLLMILASGAFIAYMAVGPG